MSAATMVLSCAMTLAQPQPALDGKAIVFNVVLQPATSAEMAAGERPLEPLQFVGEAEPKPGWIVHNSFDPSQSPIMFGRVTADPRLAMRWGRGERQADGRYAFSEAMRGACNLIPEGELP